MIDFGSITTAMKATNWNPRAAVAEFVAMTFFVFVGCGTAVTFSSVPSGFEFGEEGSALGYGSGQLRKDLLINGSYGVSTALAFGMGILVLVYAISHISGGHLNPAVTTALFLSGNVGWVQAVANIIAQCLGSILAAGLLYGMTPNAGDSALGSNIPSQGYSKGMVFLGEAVMTALLCFTVLMTAVDKDNKNNVKNIAPLAIGFSVFLGHTVLLPVDGCSINPARSLGPALVANEWADGDFWLFVVGPLAGAVAATLLHFLLSFKWESDDAAAEIGVDRTGDAEAESNKHV